MSANDKVYDLNAKAGSIAFRSSPLGTNSPSKNGVIKYKVKSGDTLSGIAADFGVTLETILTANPTFRSRAPRVNEDLIVLPVSGILYEVKDGDTLGLIASRYRISEDSVKDYNPNYQKQMSVPGALLVLPGAKALGRVDYVNRYFKGLPDLGSYFVLPAKGWNWGELHEYNAVDIADSCGKPIYAAADGLVVIDDNLGNGATGWNNGYGLFVLIEHPNGTQTRYAHNSKNLVAVGDYVKQGEEIALIGSTGNTHGATGCHLHFEVYGARNPFAVR